MRILLGVLPALLLAVTPAQAEPFRYPEGKLGTTGELRYLDRLPVLVVSGTPEQMGDAVGVLALKPGARAADYPHDIVKFHHAEALWPLLVTSGNGMVRQFPAAYKTEMDAMAAAAHVEYERLVASNTMFDLKNLLACSAVMAEGQRSATGGPLLARNLDYPSLGYIHEYSLVTVYRPKGKHAFAAVGFPGLVGCVSGMNDAGLTVAVLEVFDVKSGESRFDPLGVPYALCLRRVLEECTTITEAKRLLEGMRRTSTINVAVADRHGVGVLEVSPGKVVLRPAEEGVCACANHFCSQELKPAHPLDLNRSFWRMRTLEAVRRDKEKLTPDELRKRLDEVNLGELTLQTMVFEPATLRLSLSAGTIPASKGPMHTLDLAPLFKDGLPAAR